MRSTSVKLAICGVSAALVLAACGDDSTSDTSSSPSTSSSATTTTMTDPSNTAAATLRAGLTGLLDDHVWLAGTATGTALSTGANSAQTKAALAALDENSVALSKAVGAAYPDAEEPFLKSWRAHIDMFVAYTVATATKDTAGQTKAKADLDGYRTTFGQLISGVVPQLPASAVAEELTPHVSTLLAAIDAQAAKSPDQYKLLATAASHMPHTAMTLATGIDENKGLTGDPNSAASTLRAGLTGLLDDHVWLAGKATGAALSTGASAAQKQAAVAALDENSVALSKAVGQAYPDAEEPFLKSWRAHIDMFVAYTVAAGKGDDAGKAKAKADLDGYRTTFGQLISGVVPQLPASAVAEELTPHVSTLLAAIDAQAANSPDQYKLLATAASHMPHTAMTLATGISANKNLAG